MRQVVTEELEEDYPPTARPQEVEELEQIVRESGERLTRKRLLKLGAGAAGATLGAALLAPAVSLGPLVDTSRLSRTPWRRGRRLVDQNGRPYRARAIEADESGYRRAGGTFSGPIGPSWWGVRLHGARGPSA